MISFSFETIRLESYSKEHISELFPLIKDNWELTTYMRWDPPGAIAEVYSLYEEREFKPYSFSVFIKETLIGRADIRTINKVSHSAEIGYWIHQSFQGNGFGTVLVRSLVHFATHTLNIKEINAQTDLENISSQKALLRAGFAKRSITEEQKRLFQYKI